MSVTAAELISRPIRQVQFVVGNLIPEGLTVLAGPRTTGKSYFALHASLAVGQGASFLDRETDQGDVLYLALEDNRDNLQRRLVRLAPEHRDLDRITFQFKARHLPGGFVAELDAWLVTVDRPRLVVVDTFNRSDPGPRNGRFDHVHVTAMLEPLQQWANRNGVAILLVYHLGELGEAAPHAIEALEGLLDTQGMLATSNAALMIRRSRRQPFAQLQVSSRDFEEQTIALTVDTETMRWSATPWLIDPLTGLSERSRQIAEVLRFGPTRLKDLASELGIPSNKASVHLSKAVRAGEVAKVDRGLYALGDRVAGLLAPAPCLSATDGPQRDDADELLTTLDATTFAPNAISRAR